MDWHRLRRPSLSRPDTLAIDIERLILTGSLRPGDRVPAERELAAALGVSRGSVREALRDLASRGLVARRPGSGTVVLDPTASRFGEVLASGLDADRIELLQVMEVRACVEPPVAARAALRATPANVAQLAGLVDEMTRDPTPAGFADLDRTFHRAIAQYTHNPLLVRLLDRVHEITEASRDESLVSAARRRSSIEEHREILRAIERHDPEGASAATAAHIDSVLRRITANAGDADPVPSGS
ncbi:FadR/GntR family transcriptional regulator [Actinoalloteichus spitiensis]|uniref:FadR/GntR family transcriptional regulator n=1 Tax=Actinoalloteichus spitiensis TaxID=252394 RepID=UPI00036DD195|nr:FadR/GntR family transcriptional regulator [Actinoalloteichus spitiensis]